MRPSNKRSRSKQNRPRTLGNIVNRVFDSSGPEGKVRGTPQQIIDKYQVLARDAQLSGDRVAAENFLQHSEHYQRMLNEAQAELAREAEQRREQGGFGGQQNGQPRRFDERDGGEGQGFERRDERGPGEPRPERREDRRDDRREDRPQGERRDDRREDRDRPQGERREDRGERGEGRMDWLGRRNRRFENRNRPEGEAREPREGGRDEESMLVETPEARAERRPEARSEPRPETRPETRPAPAAEAPAVPEAEAPAQPRPPRRGPRQAPEAAAPEAAPVAPEAEAADAPRRAPRRRRAAGDGTPDAAE